MANFNINKVILGGRLSADPELKQTQGGTSVCSFSIAVNRKYQKDGNQEADFINIVAWRTTAEFVCKYFKKGSSICVVGSIQNRSWEDNNGNKRYATEVIADEVVFVDSKSDGQATANTGNYIPNAYTAPQGQFEEIPDNGDDLPF